MKRCIDCGKKISRKAERCKSCSKKGKNNGRYIDGRANEIYYCIEPGCNNKISFPGNHRCQSCANRKTHNFGNNKGENNPMFGKSLKKQKTKHHVNLIHSDNDEENIMYLFGSDHRRLHLLLNNYAVKKLTKRQIIRFTNKLIKNNIIKVLKSKYKEVT